MSTHTLAEAQDHLPDLIDRALRGEGVVITRDGEPAVELRAVAKPPAKAETVSAWLADFRRDHPKEVADAVALVRAMREEGP